MNVLVPMCIIASKYVPLESKRLSVTLNLSHSLPCFCPFISLSLSLSLSLGSSLLSKHVCLNSKDTFCLYNFIKILSSFLISLAFRLELVNEFTKIVQRAFRGH